jgi:hypothetical protein
MEQGIVLDSEPLEGELRSLPENDQTGARNLFSIN